MLHLNRKHTYARAREHTRKVYSINLECLMISKSLVLPGYQLPRPIGFVTAAHGTATPLRRNRVAVLAPNASCYAFLFILPGWNQCSIVSLLIEFNRNEKNTWNLLWLAIDRRSTRKKETNVLAISRKGRPALHSKCFQFRLSFNLEIIGFFFSFGGALVSFVCQWDRRLFFWISVPIGWCGKRNSGAFKLLAKWWAEKDIDVV